MDMRRFSGSSFIKPEHVEAGPIRATIVAIKEGSFGKPDITLDVGGKLSLNVTNTRTLVAAFGANGDDWLGEEIELYLGTVKYRGAEQESVLVRPLSKGKPAAERTPPPAQDQIDDEIPF
jgi:hypothetical protein